MSKILTAAAVQKYATDGFCDPIPLLSHAEAAAARAGLEAFESENGGPLHGGQRFKSHLLFKWLSDLTRDDRVLDAVEDLIGPDILLWSTDWFIKEVNSGQYVSWHQDSGYWGLETRRLVSVWIALSPATIESGCMRIIPGSQEWADMEHVETFADDNMLTRGQSIEGLDDSQAVDLEVPMGSGALFNYRIVHSSPPNGSDDRRIGVVLRYIPPETRQIKADWDCAALVRGQDPHGHFEHEPFPAHDLDPAAVAFHEMAQERRRQIYYQGTEWNEFRT